MHSSKIALRYAKSLLSLAVERESVDAVGDDMQMLKAVVDQNRDFRNLLDSPVVNQDKKQKVLDAIFGERIHELTKAFIRILITKGREDLLADVAASFVAQNKKRKGILTAQVVTAVALDDALRSAVNEIVKKMNDGGTIDVTEEVDPDIIGGFVLKVEDRMVDASIQSQLRTLHRELIDTSYEASI